MPKIPNQSPKELAAACAETLPSSLRVLRRALGDLLVSDGAAMLSPIAIGCLVALSRFVCERAGVDQERGIPVLPVGASILVSIKDAQASLMLKGLGFADSDLILSALRIAGLLRGDALTLSIPAVDKAFTEESAILASRRAGRSKRVDVAPRPLIALAAQASAVSPVETQPETQLELLELSSTPATTISLDASEVVIQPAKNITPQAVTQQAVKRPLASTGLTRRFTDSDSNKTDSESDPVMVRLTCEGGKIAELTKAYVDNLQETFRHIDALEQLKRAALWCESNPPKRKTFAGLRRFINLWLNSSSKEAEVRKAVVRAGNQKNGFGQGGDYTTADSKLVDAGVQQESTLDDFTDLLPLGAPVAHEVTSRAVPALGSARVASDPIYSGESAVCAVSASKALLAARANAAALRTGAGFITQQRRA